MNRQFAYLPKDASYQTIADIKLSCRKNRAALILAELKKEQPHVVTVSLYKRSVDINEVLDSLPICAFLVPDQFGKSNAGHTINPRVYHLDVGHYVQNNVDFLLFNLLILGSLTNSDGYVWLKMPYDLYYVENMPIYTLVKADAVDTGAPITAAAQQQVATTVKKVVHTVLDFLPQHVCWSPKETLEKLKSGPVLPEQLADLIVDEDGEYWFPYMHLREFDSGKNDYYKVTWRPKGCGSATVHADAGAAR